jgi:hypothetical protein
LFDGSGNPVGDRVLSPVDGQPAEQVYTSLPGGQSYFVAVFSHRFEDHPVGGDYRIDVDLDTFDFGDAPASYATLFADNGPSHLIVSGLYLGSGVDNEWEGQPGAAADGDDSAGSDDEGGVVFFVFEPRASGSFSMERVSVGGWGEANGESSHPSIGGSANMWGEWVCGQFVAFESDATNLVGGPY